MFNRTRRFGILVSRIRRNPRLSLVLFLIFGVFVLFFLYVLRKTLSVDSNRSKFHPLTHYTGGNFNVLVSGGAGFIGSHVVEFFENEEKCRNIYVLDNLHTGFRRNLEGFGKVIFFEGDIMDRELVKVIFKENKIDYVFHLAALISAVESVDKAEEYLKINSMGMNIVLQESEKSPSVKRFILASSAAIYGSNPLVPKDEFMNPPDCESPYAISKLDGEFLNKIVTQTSKKEGFLAISLRFFNVFGQRQDPNSEYAAVIPKFVERACINKKIMTVYGDGEQTRDFVYVKDVVNAMVHLAFNKRREDFKGKFGDGALVYNVGYERSLSVNELAGLINSWCGVSGKYIEHLKERPGDVKHSRARVSKLKSEGWIPKYDFRISLKRTVDWFITNWDRIK